MENSPGTPPPPPAPDGSGAPAPQVVYVQPGQQVVYVQPQPGQPAPPPVHYQQPVYQQPVYQQPYRASAFLPPSSGFRIGAGILSIVLGAWSLFMFLAMMLTTYGPSTPLSGFMNFFHLVGSVAVFTLGIMIIVKHRRRSTPIPAMLLGAAVWLSFIDLIHGGSIRFTPMALIALSGTVPIIVLSLLAIKQGADANKQK